jgi:hypothetical protein
MPSGLRSGASRKESFSPSQRAAPQDVVLRLEPGRVEWPALLVDRLLEAHEGVHLVRLALDRLRHTAQACHVAVSGIGKQPLLAAAHHAPERAVHERPALGIAVAGAGLEKARKLARDARPGPGLGGRLIGEERRTRGRFPRHVLRRDRVGEQRPRLPAPGGEIDRGGGVHG